MPKAPSPTAWERGLGVSGVASQDIPRLIASPTAWERGLGVRVIHSLSQIASYTADLFSTPIVMVVVASSVLLWLLVWLIRRLKVKKLRMTGSDRTQ